VLGTLVKARQVLDLYSPSRPEWGVTEVALQCGWPPSSTHLLLSSLTQMGLLHRTVSGRYRLGFKLLKLSQILLHNTPWREVATQGLQLLSQQTGETSYAAALDGDHLITLAARPGRHTEAVPPEQIDEALPLHVSAAGKVMLAFRTPPIRLPRRLVRLTPQTISSKAQLLLQLEQIRRLELAFSLGEAAGGTSAVAAPIFNHNAEVIAAISLISPVDRFTVNQTAWANAVVLVARSVSAQIGYWPEEAGQRLLWVSSGGVDSLRTRQKSRS
jgi:IclR family KDG regulon transcriptional repressor